MNQDAVHWSTFRGVEDQRRNCLAASGSAGDDVDDVAGEAGSKGLLPASFLPFVLQFSKRRRLVIDAEFVCEPGTGVGVDEAIAAYGNSVCRASKFAKTSLGKFALV